MANKVLDKQNENSKCVLFVRASTNSQELQSQRKELEQWASSYGFDAAHRIVLQEKGSSARKLNALYLKQIEELEKAIKADDSIICVFLWEVSRLARTNSYAHRIKDFCVSKKVQMMIKQPSLTILEMNGNLNTGQSTTFAVLAEYAANEMTTTLARMTRGKKDAQDNGKFGGGEILFGYKVDKDGYIRKDEEKAEIVREIFDRYNTGKESTQKIHNDLVERGFFPYTDKFSTGISRVLNILKNYTYAGISTSNNRYPAIVTKETVDKAIELCKSAQSKAKSIHKNLYFCKGLIVDAATNFVMIAHANNLTYRTPVSAREHSFSVNINALDYIAWYTATYLKNTDLKKEIANNKIEYKNAIQKNELIIINKQNEKEQLKKKVQNALRTQIMIQDSEFFNADDIKVIIDEANKRMKDLTNDITVLEQRNTQYQNLLNGIENNEAAINFEETELDDIAKKQIIDSVIEKILVKEQENGTIKIKVVNKVGYIDNTYFLYDTKGHYVSVSQCKEYDNKPIIDFTDVLKTHRRFERKRYEKPQKALAA